MKRLLTTITALFFVGTLSANAVEATQVINLSDDWNAVWLEVEPTYAEGDTAGGVPLAADDPRIGLSKAPEDVFDHANIQTVATPKVLSGIAEIFDGDSPTSVTFNQEGWRQWNQTGQIGDNLARVQGNRPYLIRVDGEVELTVTGKVEFFRHQWMPDRYNLVGFGIDPNNAPTFGDFFTPSGGRHPIDISGQKIHRLLTDGTWAEVSPADLMQHGEAYWVFCSGNSHYMGPVAVDFDGATSGQLNFSGPGDAVVIDPLTLDLEEITFTNLSSGGTTPGLELIAGGQDLTLRVVKPEPDSLGYLLGNQVDSTPADGNSADLEEQVASQTSATLTLGAQRNWSSGAVGRTNLYRLRTGAGTEFWLPISAAQSNIQLPTDIMAESDAGRVAGLWIGEVVIDAVTSIVETGSPVRPASSKAPLRILLHSDASGAVKLLSQVTLMQTKTAAPAVAPAPVLVLDPARIPFYEGIKERGGKRVGLRIESVAFDMPRKLDPASQDALVEGEPQLALATPAEFAAYLNSLSLRPPSLAKDYELSWPLEGALGAGKTVRTASSSPLRLDPFHRSNPFRHAFHQKHPRWPNITRTIEIVFDAEQPVADRLVGSYRETVTGLASESLTGSGGLQLQRVSTVESLEQ